MAPVVTLARTNIVLPAAHINVSPSPSPARKRDASPALKKGTGSQPFTVNQLKGWASLAEREEFKARERLDPLLNDDPDRINLTPIHHHDLWAHYKKQQSCFWHYEEIDFQQDIIDWQTKLNKDERECIAYVLGFFANSDVIVNENIGRRFMSSFKCMEAEFNFRFQMHMEDTHTETYIGSIDTLIKDPLLNKKAKLATTTVPAIKRKAEWQRQVIENEELSVAERLIAAICVEGIFFSSSFCVLGWLKKRSLLPGLTFSNEMISRDEGLHAELTLMLYAKLHNHLPPARIHAIFESVYECEANFVRDALRCNMVGMNQQLMLQYVKCVMNTWLVNHLHVEPLFANVKNPFPWMKSFGINGKSNQFERTVGEYNKQTSTTQVDYVFNKNTPF